MMQNADPKELAKFSELAHKWWDPESEFRPLHQINPLRLEWIEQCAGSLDGRQVVDVGCGGLRHQGQRPVRGGNHGCRLCDRGTCVVELALVSAPL